MYIDERLLKILETHKGETADVNFIISPIKTIAKEYETEQLRIGGVVGQSEQLPCDHENGTEAKAFKCDDCGDFIQWIK
jgi:hypothetical protein